MSGSKTKTRWYQKATVQAAIVAGVFALAGVIGGTLILKDWGGVEPVREIVPFKEEDLSVLVLSFDPIESSSIKTEDMALAVYKNLSNTIIDDDSLDNFVVRYEPQERSPSNHGESRILGTQYKADIVVWGDQWGRNLPDTSKINIRYTVVDINNQQSYVVNADTGVRTATTDQVYEGILLDDVNYIISYLRAYYHYKQWDFVKAKDYFERASTFVDDSSDISLLVELYFYLGSIHSYLAEYPEAIEDLEKASQIDPDYLRASVALGIVYWRDGQREKAKSIFRQIIQVSPESWMDFHVRGIAFHYLNQFEEAIKDYSQSLELNPNFALDLHNRASSYNSLGQHEKAIEDLEQALKINPNYVPSYVDEGKAYIGLGQLEKAIEVLDQAIRMQPKYYLAFVLRGEVLTTMGQHEKAIEDLEQALKINPNFLEAYGNLSHVYISLGQLEKAIEVLDRVIRMSPQHPIAHYNKACALARMKKKEEAIESLQKALEYGILKISYVDIEVIMNDPDLNNVRQDSQYIELIQQYTRKVSQ